MFPWPYQLLRKFQVLGSVPSQVCGRLSLLPPVHNITQSSQSLFRSLSLGLWSGRWPTGNSNVHTPGCSALSLLWSLVHVTELSSFFSILLSPFFSFLSQTPHWETQYLSLASVLPCLGERVVLQVSMFLFAPCQLWEFSLFEGWRRKNGTWMLVRSKEKGNSPENQQRHQQGYLFFLLSHSVVSNSFLIPRTVTLQAPLFLGFPREEYWSGLPFSPSGDLPDPGIKPESPALQANSLPLSNQGS